MIRTKMDIMVWHNRVFSLFYKMGSHIVIEFEAMHDKGKKYHLHIYVGGIYNRS